ncbi:MAG: hypothetical protein ACI9G1_003183 [Pirellulaceae bacterium]|jgi:hypothetical protein
MAGTAIPDWLNIIDRRMKTRRKSAIQFVKDADTRVAKIARGIVQHHHDDDWFHRTRAFAELNLQLTVMAREALPNDEGFRPSFLGHILVELLLDGILYRQQPDLLDRYYEAIERIDVELLQDTINRISNRNSELIVTLIPKFCSARFLYDYVENEKLLMRLNGVMKRVKLNLLPDSFANMFSAAREMVEQRQDELLAGEADPVIDLNGDGRGPNEDTTQ